MRLLRDTQVFLWSISATERLSRRAPRVIEDGANDVFLTAASAWEIAIKAGLAGSPRRAIPGRFVPDQMSANAFQPLPVELRHALAVYGLPKVHSDPFDRLLVAQAIAEELTIVTSDERLGTYPVKVLW